MYVCMYVHEERPSTLDKLHLVEQLFSNPFILNLNCTEQIYCFFHALNLFTNNRLDCQKP